MEADELVENENHVSKEVPSEGVPKAVEESKKRQPQFVDPFFATEGIAE